MKRLVVLFVFALAGASLHAELTRESMRAYAERARVRYRDAAPRVLAVYHAWYGGPGRDGRYLHWDRVDAGRKESSGSTHYPELGAYDSLDPEIIARHCAWAKQAAADALLYDLFTLAANGR